MDYAEQLLAFAEDASARHSDTCVTIMKLWCEQRKYILEANQENRDDAG